MALVSKPSKKVTIQQKSTSRHKILPGCWLSMICATSIVAGWTGDVCMRGLPPCQVPRRASDSRVVNGRAPHITPVHSVFERSGPMHCASIVPDHEVSGLLPRHRAHEPRLGCELDQLTQQLAAFLDRPTHDVGGM